MRMLAVVMQIRFIAEDAAAAADIAIHLAARAVKFSISPWQA
jgi:hypothetical protein